MIRDWFVSGDTHGDFSRFKDSAKTDFCSPEETAIIILGDAGFNFCKNDKEVKTFAKRLGYHFYCVRGNHEQRPELMPNMTKIYDEEVQNEVYVEKEFPTIKYFIDGECYRIAGLRTLVLGGAYSIDKYYRLERAGVKETAPDEVVALMAHWFSQEQLTEKERKDILNRWEGQEFDLVLSHTCPISWEPTDLFLRFVDQNTVDKTMENWLEDMKTAINWNVWLFGHYHADRIEKPFVEILYTSVRHLLDLYNIWITPEDREEYIKYAICSPKINRKNLMEEYVNEI